MDLGWQNGIEIEKLRAVRLAIGMFGLALKNTFRRLSKPEDGTISVRRGQQCRIVTVNCALIANIDFPLHFKCYGSNEKVRHAKGCFCLVGMPTLALALCPSITFHEKLFNISNWRHGIRRQFILIDISRVTSIEPTNALQYQSHSLTATSHCRVVRGSWPSKYHF